jgi:hypothetical protein
VLCSLLRAARGPLRLSSPILPPCPSPPPHAPIAASCALSRDALTAPARRRVGQGSRSAGGCPRCFCVAEQAGKCGRHGEGVSALLRSARRLLFPPCFPSVTSATQQHHARARARCAHSLSNDEGRAGISVSWGLSSMFLRCGASRQMSEYGAKGEHCAASCAQLLEDPARSPTPPSPAPMPLPSSPFPPPPVHPIQEHHARAFVQCAHSSSNEEGRVGISVNSSVESMSLRGRTARKCQRHGVGIERCTAS